MSIPRDRFPVLQSPAAFFAGVLAWSWGFWLLLSIFAGQGLTTTVGTAFGILGLLGPMVAGITFTHLTRDRQGRRDYWARVFNPGRIPARWVPIIVLLAAALMLAAALIDLATGGALAPYHKAVEPFLSKPAMLVPFTLNIFFVGPFPEEFGWRGYVLDRLQERWSALEASLVLGVVWSLWHLPQFFMQGTYQYMQGAGSLWFWLFIIGIVPLTVVFTWVFNNTRRSTLAIIILHLIVVLTDDFLNVSAGANIASTLLWIGLAVGVVVTWKAATLSRADDPVNAERAVPSVSG